jgi:hypothetical protein
MAETGLAEVMGTALETVSSDILGMIWVVIPIALGIVGTVLAVKFGVKFFRQIAGR